MKALLFRGGIHPYDGKELSKDKPIKSIYPKGELVYPLSQHIGAPSMPVVKKGDKVLVGQKIAEAQGFVSAPIHSTVSGLVKAIEPRLTVTGTMINSIIVENDFNYREIEWPKRKPIEEFTREEKLEVIREAGIVGMGGAGFPTHVKLSFKDPDNIDYIIANCAECEPYLTSDYRRMMEDSKKIVGGLAIAVSLFKNARGIIAVEDNKSDAIERLIEACENEPKIEVISLKTKYPQGAERMLIYGCTGRKINSSQLPADVGCIVNNADTITAIYNAFYERKPLMYRIVTVTGDAIADPRNFYVPIGTSYRQLVEEAGGFKEEPVKIISGGPMMGFGVFNLDIPVTKTSSALLCLTKDEVAEMEPTACINCGRCVSVCPENLLPSRLASISERYDEESFLKFDGMECCECGCCAFTCPAKRPLTQSIKSMRRMLLAKKKRG